MKDVQDMTNEELYLERVRAWAASEYAAAGYGRFAEQVQQGKKDDCQQMRVAVAMLESIRPHSKEFVAAWDGFAAAGMTSE